MPLENRELEARLQAAMPVLRRSLPVPVERQDSIIMSAILTALERMDRFTGPGEAISRFLVRVARNKLIDRYRKQARHPPAPLEQAADRPAGGGSPESLLIAQDERRRVQIAMARLDPEQRRILELRYGWADDQLLPETEVARRLGMTRDKARGELRRAEAALVALLSEPAAP